jgi:hypothetical protein
MGESIRRDLVVIVDEGVERLLKRRRRRGSESVASC